jgi:hypothetical protein
MTYDAFRRYLTSDHRSPSTGRAFSAHAAGDYPSRLRRLEALLQLPLENSPPMLLQTLADGLRQDTRVTETISPKVIGDIVVALRTYANFLKTLDEELIVEPWSSNPGLDAQSIIVQLRVLGFEGELAAPKKIVGFTKGGLTLYVRMTSERPVILHPAFEEIYSALSRVPGIIKDRYITFYHNAQLSGFPTRDNGKGLVNYGIPFGFNNPAALHDFIAEVESALSSASLLGRENDIFDEIRIIETEATVIAKARRGQGRFRADLLNFWRGQCALSGVSAPELLRASHIKSWKDSNNTERLDAFNGLLLAVHLDALFDRALISFRDSGEMMISKRLSITDREIFGLTEQGKKLLLNLPHLSYMHHHHTRFLANEEKDLGSGST